MTYAHNLTDIYDKIEAAANAAGVPIGTITDHYFRANHADLAALGVLSLDVDPRVTDRVPKIVVIIAVLIERGHAYLAEGHDLFEVASFADYGRLYDQCALAREWRWHRTNATRPTSCGGSPQPPIRGAGARSADADTPASISNARR